jgi:prephenate dehydrogenase
VPSESARKARVCILGAGLIGGSLAAALRSGGHEGFMTGYSPAPDGARAQVLGLIDRCAESPVSAVAGADWVVLAAPVMQMPALLQAIAPAIGPTTLITDCGSTKLSVIEAARVHLGAAFDRFVAGHPIAGSERHGPDAARPDLFRGKRWILCPTTPAQRALVPRVSEFLTPTGARLSELDPVQHDRIFAEVSHWPHALAFAMAAAIGSGELAEAAIDYCGAGLRDTSRIAASPAELWADILLDNAGPVLESAQRFERELDQLNRALQTRDRGLLVDLIARGSMWRNRIE